MSPGASVSCAGGCHLGPPVWVGAYRERGVSTPVRFRGHLDGRRASGPVCERCESAQGHCDDWRPGEPYVSQSKVDYEIGPSKDECLIGYWLNSPPPARGRLFCFSLPPPHFTMHSTDLRDPRFRAARDPDKVYSEALRQHEGSSMEDLRAEAGRIRDREMQSLNYGVAISPGRTAALVGSRSASDRASVADSETGGNSERGVKYASGGVNRAAGGGALVRSGAGPTTSSVGRERDSGRGRIDDEDEEIDPEDFQRWLKAHKAVDGGAVQLSEDEEAWDGDHPRGETSEKRSW